jgi:hypothetical protein
MPATRAQRETKGFKKIAPPRCEHALAPGDE